MYLWRKDAGFFFQMRIPARQAVNLGATPLRIWLGALKKRDAQRRATVLAVAAVGRTEAAGILHEIGVVAGSHALYRGLSFFWSSLKSLAATVTASVDRSFFQAATPPSSTCVLAPRPAYSKAT